MKTYDLIFFRHYLDPDDIAMLYPVENGKWVKAEDVELLEDKILHLKEALLNLKHCNMKLSTPEQLNDYVDKVLQGYV